ncbi:MAG: septum formation initiator family protein [Campylobacteraceae bacterium]|jgi:hypothetical protein|nr:septum formation initiator family protein [Campylobacteraceae bacterium]
MNEILEELGAPKRKPLFDFSRGAWKLLALFSLVAVFAVYTGNLLFGQNSVSTLFSLEDQRDHLKSEIEKLKEQNAKYQKEYFELKRLEGDK